jgi:hypothetical protein
MQLPFLPIVISINMLKRQLPLGWTCLLDNGNGAGGTKVHGHINKQTRY